MEIVFQLNISILVFLELCLLELFQGLIISMFEELEIKKRTVGKARVVELRICVSNNAGPLIFVRIDMVQQVFSCKWPDLGKLTEICPNQFCHPGIAMLFPRQFDVDGNMSRARNHKIKQSWLNTLLSL